VASDSKVSNCRMAIMTGALRSLDEQHLIGSAVAAYI
jgi:hypothetical protein